MTTSLMIKKPLAWIILTGLIAAPSLSQAVENKRVESKVSGVQAPADQPMKSSKEEIEKLQRLKKENPEEFRRIVRNAGRSFRSG